MDDDKALPQHDTLSSHEMPRSLHTHAYYVVNGAPLKLYLARIILVIGGNEARPQYLQ